MEKIKTFTFGKHRKITIAVRAVKLGSITLMYKVEYGYSIQNPSDSFNEKLGIKIALGRLHKRIYMFRDIIHHKPSNSTLENLAKDFYNHMMDNKDYYFIDTKKNKTKK